MAANKQRAYYKALRNATAATNSDFAIKSKLHTIVRSTSGAINAAVSLVLLDSSGKKLVHTSSWGLRQLFIAKGALDADKSIGEILSGQPVAISDVANDQRVQFPRAANSAGIASALAVPIINNRRILGSIRVYTHERTDFSKEDISFVTSMSHLAAMALTQPGKPGLQPATETLLRTARTTRFANPSEKELADVMDFYNIEWIYEPRSFPLKWDGDRITEAFAPDFYLPGLDLYIEVTTMKQHLATKKNRKLRELNTLYPDVHVMLLHKDEYDRLLGRYGYGPLADTRARGVAKVLFNAEQIATAVQRLAGAISHDYSGKRPLLLGVQRGFICFMSDLIRHISIPLDIDFVTVSYYSANDHSTFRLTKDLDFDIAGRHVIVIEGVVDTGMTLASVLKRLESRKPASLSVCSLLDKKLRRIADVQLKYVGFEVKDEFVVGYGLDYKEEYRNLPFIGVADLEIPKKNRVEKERPR
jgi:bifunctional protein TilS/HprT